MTAPAASQRKPLLVVVSGVTGHGGPNASLRAVVPLLGSFECLLVGPYRSAERTQWTEAGVLVEAVPRPRGLVARTRAVARLSRLVWRLRHRRPVLFANGLTEAALLAPIALISRLVLFVWVHNYAVPRIAVALSPLLRRIAAGPLTVAAVSRMAARVAREVFGEIPVVVVPNPIDRSFWDVRREPIGDRRLRVSYVAGTDRRYKGFDLLPSIVTASDELGVDWLVVAAEATQPEAWRALRRSAGALRWSSVELRGRTDRVQEIYAITDVVLIPSRQESFCRVAAEAMASGAAVVAARLDAIVEVCGDVAEYFPSEDPVAATAALRRLIADPDRVEEMGRRGRARAGRFTRDAVVARLRDLLGDRAEGASRAAPPRTGGERLGGR